MPPVETILNEDVETILNKEPTEKIVTKVDGAKTYIITSRKDEPIERAQVEVVETVTRNERQFSGTLQNLESDLSFIDQQIDRLTAEKSAKLALKAELISKLEEK